MFVIDTNTVIYYFKGQGNVASRLSDQSPREIAIPTIVIFELEVGIAKSNNPDKRVQQLRSLLNNVVILPFGVSEAQEAATIRATLELQGNTIGPYDILIAAVAQANRATLVTRNVSEFSRVANLNVVDWY